MYGIYDPLLEMWLIRKPACNNGRLLRADWQEKPCYPFSEEKAREALDCFPRIKRLNLKLKRMKSV